jgi:hypothetical protein
LDDFCREELGDCESFNEAMREIKRLQLQRSEVKLRLDRQLEAVGMMMDQRTGKGNGKFKSARAELEQLERDF